MRFMPKRKLDAGPSPPGTVDKAALDTTAARQRVLLSCAERMFVADRSSLESTAKEDAANAFDFAETFLEEAIRRGYVP
jgi:hypothetical protein